MCVICLELIKQRLTVNEAENASKEMVISSKSENNHYAELSEALEDGDLEKLGELIEEGISEPKKA